MRGGSAGVSGGNGRHGGRLGYEVAGEAVGQWWIRQQTARRRADPAGGTWPGGVVN